MGNADYGMDYRAATGWNNNDVYERVRARAHAHTHTHTYCIKQFE